MNTFSKFLFLFGFFTLFISCGKKESTTDTDNLYKFRDYVTYHTTGRISVTEHIRIELAKTLDQFDLTQELPSDFLQISPKTPGKLVIENGKSIVFIPEKNLKPDTEYSVTLKLDKLYDDLKKEFRSFAFSFKTIAPNFKISIEDLQSYSKDWQYLSATLQSNEVISPEDLPQLVKASQGKKPLKVVFKDNSSPSKLFHFVIDSVQRFEDDSEIMLSWDGKSIQSETKGEAPFTIAGKNNFSVVNVTAHFAPNSHLKINFSDPIRENQNFNGLVTIQNKDKLRFEVEGNLLRVYPQERIVGEKLVEIFQGITSADGYKLKNPFSELISFEQLKPAIRLVSNGVILPNAASTPFYFEAVNLNTVEVRIIKIFENNVLQYLQTSNLNDNSIHNLNRVGRRIAKKTITLNDGEISDDGQWKAYGLNLSEYFTADPGALYRIELSFKKEHTNYNCQSQAVSQEENNDDDYYYDDYDSASSSAGEEEREQQYWDNRIYRWRTYTYNWRERDNPCHDAYYNGDRILSTNILGSNLGLIVKKGANQSYHFATSNLLTTNPEGGVKIALYNFQQQLITTITTQPNGLILFDGDKNIAFAVAQKDNNYAYAKLDDGNALSLSKFDVSGKQLQKGLKGFIYTERGVHRPGDSIHLSFVLNDLSNPLPKDHPVTLEVSDARGKVVHKTVARQGVNNVFYFPIATEATAPTGNWRATINVGGAEFTETLRIATVKPNRLKINLTFDDEVLSVDKPIVGNAHISWLHGAPARNLNIEMDATIRETNTAFKGFPNYIFTDPVRRFEETEIPVLKGKLNEEGKIAINKRLELGKNAPGMLRANFLTKVFEGGGDFSIDVISKDVAPFTHFVGLQSPKARAYGSYFTDENNTFDVATVDEKGAASGNRDLEVKIFKIEWRWWWSRGQDNLSSYENATVHRPVQEFKIKTAANGKTTFNLNIPDEESGRYLIRIIDPKSGHATGRVAYFYRNWWSRAGAGGDAESAKMLVFSADKEKYNVGETATITFPSGSEGRALLSIENGTEVLGTQWIETKKGETQATIPITKEMAPNIYVNISLLQPHEQTANDLPIRLYGVIPLLVEDPTTILQPQLELPDVLKPEEKFTIKVSEKNKKAMTYTIAVVDEGLLDLTRFKTPAIHQAFYTREALGVRTFDMYDYVIGAYSGSVENIYAVGGGDEAAGAKNRKADRFKPVVMYLGPFTLKAGEKASHNLTMPNYIGSVRTMVVAADNKNAAYGNAEKATPVRKPLMVLASLPRKLSPGEKVTLPVTVFAMESKVKNVSVNVTTSAGLKPLNGNNKSISFSSVGEQIVNFEYEVLATPGIQTIEISASGGGEIANYKVEIDVENPNPVTQKVSDFTLEPNAQQNISFSTFGVAGSNAAYLEFSTLPPMDFTKRMEYLIQYPHGCVEQTTSAAFPQLYLAAIFDITLDRKQKIQSNIELAIRRLNTFQSAGGGISYWPGEREADEWSTNYVGHFMMEAKSKGYALPVTFLSNWLRFQQNAARQWRPNVRAYNTELTQAYRLYTLALAGQPELAAMNRLRETKNLSNDAKWRLAAAYALAGQDRVANHLLQSATINFQPKNDDYHSYGSPFRNKAMALETMVLINDAKQRELSLSIARDLSSSKWYSTQETSFALMALAKMVSKSGGKALEVSYIQNGKSQTIKTHQAVAQREIGFSMGENELTLKNTKDNVIYVRLIQSGKLPVGDELAERRNLNVVTNYFDGEGKIIDVSSLRQGTEITAQIRIENTSNDFVDNVALSQLFPSGWEIVNTSFTELGGGASGNARYTDIRDDRVHFYFDLNRKESKTFTVKLNASYLGSYYLPGSQAEAMYDNNYLARNKGQWIKVEQ